MDRRLFRQFVRWMAPILFVLLIMVWALVPFVTQLDELALACLGRAPATMHPRWWSCRVLNHFRSIPSDAETRDGRPLLSELLARADGDKPDDEIFAMATNLVDRGLSIDRPDRRSGLNALQDAIVGGRPFVVAFLLVRGANPELPVSGTAGPPMAGEKPLQLVSRLLERDDRAKAKAQTIADLLREAIASRREERSSAIRTQ